MLNVIGVAKPNPVGWGAIGTPIESPIRKRKLVGP